MANRRILFIFTSVGATEDGREIGSYIPGLGPVYYDLAPHFDITFASLTGENPPITTLKSDTSLFIADPTVQEKLSSTIKLCDVKVEDYVAVYYVPGLGPVHDLAASELNGKVASDFFNSGKIVSGLCHAPAALVLAKDTHGNSIFHGRNATSLSVPEEHLSNVVQHIPFLPEEKIRELGGKYTNIEPFTPYIVADGNLVTGQNPASSALLAQKLIELLRP